MRAKPTLNTDANLADFQVGDLFVYICTSENEKLGGIITKIEGDEYGGLMTVRWQDGIIDTYTLEEIEQTLIPDWGDGTVQWKHYPRK